MLTQRVLLVIGEAHSGNTLGRFEEELISMNPDCEVRRCCFYKQTTCTQDIEYVGIEEESMPLMPWQDADYIRDSISKKNAEILEAKRHKIA